MITTNPKHVYPIHSDSFNVKTIDASQTLPSLQDKDCYVLVGANPIDITIPELTDNDIGKEIMFVKRLTEGIEIIPTNAVISGSQEPDGRIFNHSTNAFECCYLKVIAPDFIAAMSLHGDWPPFFQSQYALIFNGVDEYMSIPHNAEFTFANGASDVAFSFNVWVKAGSFANTRNFILMKGSNDNNSSKEYEIYFTNAGIITFRLIDANNGEYLQSVSTANQNDTIDTWTMWTFTYDGTQDASGLEIYKNGALITQTKTEAGTYDVINNTTDTILVGAGRVASSVGDYFDCIIDELSIWRKELSGAEVTTLYHGGTPNNLDTAGISNLVGWWKMGDNDSIPNIYDRAGSDDATTFNMSGSNITTDVPA